MIVAWVAFATGIVLGSVMTIIVQARQNRATVLVDPDGRFTLKFICVGGHEWFGECVPAVCPRCHRPAIGAHK